MEVEEIQTQACKFTRIGNGRIDPSKMSPKDQYPDDEEDREEQQQQQQQLQFITRGSANNNAGGGLGGDSTGGGGGANRLRGWNHSSRIIRVSRASGGKDRHSKVWTSKGLRDRRVRLSVNTAIQFYDLQDRLGYDQPSKAIEWLIKAAADSIAELPSLNSSSFPDTPKQLSDEKRASECTDQQVDSVEFDGDRNNNNNYQQNHSQHRSLSKSACSSNSETSKGSGLSLSRSDLRVNRVKARERARERAAKEKDQKENEFQINASQHHHHNVNPISQSSSFTELLTGGIGGVHNNNNTSPTGSSQPNEEANFFHKVATAARPWPATPPDYFYSGLLGSSSSRPPQHFSRQIQLGSSNSLPQAMAIPPFSVTNENHQEMQHFSFVPDHLIPVTATQPGSGGGDYNLNFTISAGLAGYNRGTLQSNSSPSLLPHLQRFGSSSPIDGSNVPFFIGTTPPPVENHHHQHQFPSGFDGRLHLYYGDGSKPSDQKDKGGKN